jgi:hypothetical protein
MQIAQNGATCSAAAMHYTCRSFRYHWLALDSTLETGLGWAMFLADDLGRRLESWSCSGMSDVGLSECVI